MYFVTAHHCIKYPYHSSTPNAFCYITFIFHSWFMVSYAWFLWSNNTVTPTCYVFPRRCTVILVFPNFLFNFQNLLPAWSIFCADLYKEKCQLLCPHVFFLFLFFFFKQSTVELSKVQKSRKQRTVSRWFTLAKVRLAGKRCSALWTFKMILVFGWSFFFNCTHLQECKAHLLQTRPTSSNPTSKIPKCTF